MTERTDSGGAGTAGAARGALLWRAIRYAVAIGVGYLAGAAAGGMSQDSPALPILLMAVAVAVFLAFRQGAKSQAHAAADAISAANARATAVAVSTQTVNVAGGHMVNPRPPSDDSWVNALESGGVRQVEAGARDVSFWERARSTEQPER